MREERATALARRADALREACQPVSALGVAVDADGTELWSQAVLDAIPEAYRGDCDYVWGSRGDEGYADELRRAHAFVQERDRHGFLASMHEDGALGAETTALGPGWSTSSGSSAAPRCAGAAWSLGL